MIGLLHYKEGIYLKTITINRSWCKKCGICVSFCPKKVFEFDSNKNPVAVNAADCVNCKLCEKRCPDFAIHVED